MNPSAPIATKAKPYQADSLLVKGTLLVTATLSVMAGATISPALPAIRATFADVPNIDFLVRLVLTIPAFFIALGSPLAGYIVDRFGRKRLLIIAVLCYALAGGSGLVVGTLVLLLVGRAVLGLAVASIRTTVITLIVDYYHGQARADFLGYQASFVGLGGVVFLSLGGVLADIGWRYPFFIYLAAIVVLPFVVFILFEPSRRENMIQGQNDVIDAAFPMGLVVFIYLMMALSQVVFYIIPVFLPFYLESFVAASATQSGLAIAGLSLAFSLSSLQFGRINKQFGYIGTLVLALTLAGTGYILITLARGWGGLAFGLAFGGMGLGLIIPNLNVWLANRVPEAMRGRALGGLNTALFLGQFISPLIGQPLVNQWGASRIYAIAGSFFLTVMVCIVLFHRQLVRWTTAPVQD